MPNLNVRYMEDFYHGEMGGGIPQKLFCSCVESQKKVGSTTRETYTEDLIQQTFSGKMASQKR